MYIYVYIYVYIIIYTIYVGVCFIREHTRRGVNFDCVRPWPKPGTHKGRLDKIIII